MNDSPAFRFYPMAYLSDVNVDVMTLEQQGAYMRLLCNAWMSDQPGRLKNDPEVLRKFARMSKEQWEQNGQSIMCAFMSPDEDGWITQKRMREEWRKQQEYKEKASFAGRVSANKRYKKEPAKELTSSTNAEHPLGTSSTNAEHSIGTSQHSLCIASSGNDLNSTIVDITPESIYNLYPKNCGKKEALRAIKSAMKKDGALVVSQKTLEYAKAVNGIDTIWIKSPDKWYRGEHYNDDPKTWRPAERVEIKHEKIIHEDEEGNSKF